MAQPGTHRLVIDVQEVEVNGAAIDNVSVQQQMTHLLAATLVVFLALGQGGCFLREPEDPPGPTVQNDTAQDIWIGTELNSGGNVALNGRVDAGSTSTVRTACTEGEVLVLEGWQGGQTLDVLSDQGIDVVYAYDGVQNPELCGEAHPDAVWVWNGRELLFTDDG